MLLERKKASIFLLAGFVVLGVFSWQRVSADILDYSSVSDMAKEMEQRYNIDPSSVQDGAQQLNVANKKGTSPEVTLNFSPSSPKPGEMITAHAAPMFFTTTNDKLYYTWYLKHKGCDADADSGYSKRVTAATKFCDEDGDGSITPNDWKLAAMKLIARGQYDGTNPSPDNGDDNDGYKAVFGGDGELDSKPKYCYIYDFSAGTQYELSSASGLVDANTVANDSLCGSSKQSEFFPHHLFAKVHGFEPGDGSFGAAEEKEWGTDPHNPSSAQNGKKDGANSVGVGAEEFSWVYFAGDQVGVAVEGVSMGYTKHKDSSKMIMWAFPKDTCVPSQSQIGSYTTPIGGNENGSYMVTIPTANMRDSDFDKCFHDNLVDPAKGGQPVNMKLSLSSSPQNVVGQVYSPSDTSFLGDTVNVQSSLEDSSTDPAVIWYQWDVRLSVDGSMNPNFDDTNSWKNITNDLVSNKQIGSIEGNGKKSLDINLNFPKSFADKYLKAFSRSQNVGYLYVKVRARENIGQEEGRGGAASVVVKFNLVGGNTINVSTAKVSIQDSGTQVKRGQDICTDSTSLATCRVLQNQIITVSVPKDNQYDSFSWTVNDQPLYCGSAISPECTDEKESALAFFPVLGNVGEQYVISVVETNSTTGESISLSRIFQIVNPAAVIDLALVDGSAGAQKRLLGFFNVNGNKVPDYSKNEFETVSGNTVTLLPLFNATSLQGNTQLLWRVNGSPAVDVDANTGILTLPISQAPGSVINIDLNGVYYQSDDIRRALQDIWGVSPIASAETTFQTQASITVYASADEESANTVTGFLFKSNKYLGAVLSYVPQSVLFGLRLALTLSLALFFVGFVKSFLPNREGGAINKNHITQFGG